MSAIPPTPPGLGRCACGAFFPLNPRAIANGQRRKCDACRDQARRDKSSRISQGISELRRSMPGTLDLLPIRTYAEVAEVLCVTKQTVEQCEMRALRRLVIQAPWCAVWQLALRYPPDLLRASLLAIKRAFRLFLRQGMSHQSDNISAGTQVVALIEVRGTNNSLVHPRGAVGVVTRTPATDGERFLVRFPDGFEATFDHEQLEVLKHFKARLGSEIGDLPTTTESFNLESFIIYRCFVGSRAYGLDHDNSDTDLRGVYLAPAELQWSLYGAPEQFEDNATQSCYWELQKFLIMALKANPNILECLYSPLVEKVTPLAEELLALRQVFLSQMIFQTFNGYAMSQFKKIEQDIRNHGQVRWKHAMHLLRLLLSGAATLREGCVPVRVETHRERLLAVKRGEMLWAEVDAWRQELHRDFEHALAETKLPERPDYEAANRFLVKARQEMAVAGAR